SETRPTTTSSDVCSARSWPVTPRRRRPRPQPTKPNPARWRAAPSVTTSGRPKTFTQTAAFARTASLPNTTKPDSAACRTGWPTTTDRHGDEPMAYPEPMNIDDIYGPGAEDADVLADEDEEDLETCEQRQREWQTREHSSGVRTERQIQA